MLANTRYTFLLLLATPTFAQNWATYPQVPQTASINGFADPIYGKLPECAQNCVKENTGNTPCPYWDTGCLCIMPQWIDPVADCFAKNCKGSEVESASSLANSLCKSVGAWWGIGATESTLLASAIGDAAAATASAVPASTTASDSQPATTSASVAAAASPASSASSSSKAESTAGTSEEKPSANAAAATSAPAASSRGGPASSRGGPAPSSSRESSAGARASSQSNPPGVSNHGAMASIAMMGAAVAAVAHFL